MLNNKSFGKVLLSILVTTVFIFHSLALNAQIMDEKSIVADGASLELLGDGFEFTEGPAPDEQGNVYFTDQPNNEILKWNASTGEVSVFMDEAGRSNGMFFDDQGNLITCADMKNQLWSIGMDGKVEVLVDNYKGKRLNGPNDLWIHPNGGIYFTDPLYERDYWERDPEMQQDGQHVYYLGPDRSRLIRVEEDLMQPNGIIGTPEGKKLYVAGIGDDKTYVYDINEDGTLSNRKLFAELGSDGITIDNEGNIYLTGEGVTVFDSEGEKIAHVPVDKDWTANVCFGGLDRDVLFITAMDSVFGLKMNVRGAY
ncbi:MAG: SMP-30/gluconolactonase/LRE family protein [Bacteroidales bacterium]|nr:SMP-30/gluconolactonase/LRE family protein [Bacteroidales bacterium]